MSLLASQPHTLSVTEAATRGLPGLVRAAENGEDIVVERHGRAVAAVVGIGHLNQIQRLERDLHETIRLLARIATDTGIRTGLDDAITTLGFNRAELEAELDADLAAGRE